MRVRLFVILQLFSHILLELLVETDVKSCSPNEERSDHTHLLTNNQPLTTGCNNSPLNSDDLEHFDEGDFSEDFMEKPMRKGKKNLIIGDSEDSSMQSNANIVIVPNSQPPQSIREGVVNSSFDEDVEFLRNLKTPISQLHNIVEDSEKQSIKILDSKNGQHQQIDDENSDGDVIIISPQKSERTVSSNNNCITSQILQNLDDFDNNDSINSGPNIQKIQEFNNEPAHCSTQIPPKVVDSTNFFTSAHHFRSDKNRLSSVPYVKIGGDSLSVISCKNISPIKPFDRSISFIEKTPSPKRLSIDDHQFFPIQRNSNIVEEENSKKVLCFSGFGSIEMVSRFRYIYF